MASSQQFHLSTFQNASVMLKSIMTKPFASFTAAKVSPGDIDQVVRFLIDVVGQRK